MDTQDLVKMTWAGKFVAWAFCPKCGNVVTNFEREVKCDKCGATVDPRDPAILKP